MIGWKLENYKLIKYAKEFIINNKSITPYNTLQTFPSSGRNDNKVLNKKYLNLTYWIISNYNKSYINSLSSGK